MLWLRSPPEQVRALLRELAAEAEMPRSGLTERVLQLANTRLDEIQLGKLGRLARKARSALGDLSLVKVGVLGDGTLSLLVDPLVGTGIRHGVLLDVVEGGYGAALQEANDPRSLLCRSGLDVAVVALDRRLAGLDRPAASPSEAAERVYAAFERVEIIVQGLKPHVRGPVLVQTLVPPLEPFFGSYDRVELSSPHSMVEQFNSRLADWARSGEIVIVDIARLAAAIGLESWDDPRHWHASKLSFAPELTPVYCDVVARTVGSVMGKSKKALVLDLDNTLWGGVIGDDGIGGITIGQGSASGEAHLAIQQLALDLRARGVVLAVCSKNEETVARGPFKEHPEMLLREEHIAVFQANWTDKASNLRAIARALNIGVDALVFLDDNPFEREQVRSELPSVAVPELPDDPAYYPRVLAAAGYFETVAFTAEDRQRASQYQANAARAALLRDAGDITAYLKSLEMVCTIGRVDPICRARVAQLINKSNQFNLTTKRYTEQEIAGLEEDPSVHAIQVRLADRLGDNGIISVVIARLEGHSWLIDTWLMSCRVLGRDVERTVLNHLVEAARRSGAEFLVGRYLPTAKNGIVADHYAKLGFDHVQDLEGGGSEWRLLLANYSAQETPMRVVDHAVTRGKDLAA